MKRTWAFAVLVCPLCSGPMRLVAAIEDPAIARRILDHLGLSSGPPPRGPPWIPQRARALERRADDFDGVDAPAVAD